MDPDVVDFCNHSTVSAIKSLKGNFSVCLVSGLILRMGVMYICFYLFVTFYLFS